MLNVVPPIGFSKDGIVEKPAIEVFRSLGWEYSNLFEERMGVDGDHGRDNRHEVILKKDFYNSIRELNPQVRDSSIDQAYEEVAMDRTVMSQVNANKEVYELLKSGFKARFENENGDEDTEEVVLIDWKNPEKNHFCRSGEDRLEK